MEDFIIISALSWYSVIWGWSLIIGNPIGFPRKEIEWWSRIGFSGFILIKNCVARQVLGLAPRCIEKLLSVLILRPNLEHSTENMSRAFWRESGSGAIIITSSANTRIVTPVNLYIAFIIGSEAKLKRIPLRGSTWRTPHTMGTGPTDPSEVDTVVEDIRIRFVISFLNLSPAPDFPIAAIIDEWEMLPKALERSTEAAQNSLEIDFVACCNFWLKT